MPDVEIVLQRTTFQMPADLHRRFRIVLVREGKTMQEVLVAMVEAWVAKREADE